MNLKDIAQMTKLEERAEKAEAKVEKLIGAFLEANKALQAIEAASYFVDGGISDWENAENKNLVQFVHDAYLMAHASQPDAECYDSHGDWRKRIDEVLKAADKAGFAKYEVPAILAEVKEQG